MMVPRKLDDFPTVLFRMIRGQGCRVSGFFHKSTIIFPVLKLLNKRLRLGVSRSTSMLNAILVLSRRSMKKELAGKLSFVYSRWRTASVKSARRDFAQTYLLLPVCLEAENPLTGGGRHIHRYSILRAGHIPAWSISLKC